MKIYGWEFTRGEFSGWEFSGGEFTGGGGDSLGGSSPGGSSPGGNFPDTLKIYIKTNFYRERERESCFSLWLNISSLLNCYYMLFWMVLIGAIVNNVILYDLFLDMLFIWIKRIHTIL